VTHITEVLGMEGEVVTTQDVFLFDYGMGVDEDGFYKGHLKSTGLRPSFSKKLEDAGIKLTPEMFAPEGFAREADTFDLG
jgi:pilus assembly protein CpaF